MADRDDLHPRPEFVPDETLDCMEREGWTPTQVRALIASYQRLKSRYWEIAIEFDRYRTQTEAASLDIAKLHAEGEALRAQMAERTREVMGDE